MDEDAVICDLAETYHILDYESLPAIKVATLVCGLRDNSRIKQKLAGVKYDLTTILLAMLVDRYSKANYDMEEERMILPKLLSTEKKESDTIAFDSVEEFKKAMQAFERNE